MRLYLVSLALFIGPFAQANDIVCRNADSGQIALQYHSDNPIPDYSFERFQNHSSYGAVFIHGVDHGFTWVNIANAGISLYYEIKLQNSVARPTAYLHLTLDKAKIFNGYLQSNNAVSGNVEMELLNCTLESFPGK